MYNFTDILIYLTKSFSDLLVLTSIIEYSDLIEYEVGRNTADVATFATLGVSPSTAYYVVVVI
jgi:hypothetical protein